MTRHFNFHIFVSFLELFSLGYVKMWHTDTWQSVLFSLRKQHAVYNYCLQLNGLAYLIDVQILGVNFVPMFNYSQHKGLWTTGYKDPRIFKLSTTCTKVICLKCLPSCNSKIHKTRTEQEAGWAWEPQSRTKADMNLRPSRESKFLCCYMHHCHCTDWARPDPSETFKLTA
jgi:hypothetical protein